MNDEILVRPNCSSDYDYSDYTFDLEHDNNPY